MSLLDALIAQGMKDNAEFTKALIEIKQRVENTPEKQAIQSLEDVTGAMQVIDDYTLQQQTASSDVTQAMKDIDDFTLNQVTELQDKVSALEAKVNGGTE